MALLMSACSTPPTRVGATSSVPGLGKPMITVTAVGDVASWEVQGAPPNATPLVLWPSIFADHTMYQGVVERLRSKYRIVLIDGPGHGASGAPPAQGFTMAQCAAAAKQVVDARGLQRVAVGGTSWGGLVGVEFAVAYPEATVAVVALNTPFLVPEEGPGMADRMITFGSRHVLNTSLFSWGVSGSFFLPATRDANPVELQNFRQHLAQADGKALSTAVRSVLLDRTSSVPLLSQVRAPTLVVAGREDAMYPHEVQAKLAASMPKATYALLPAQHLAAVDVPADVASLIDQFLTKLR